MGGWWRGINGGGGTTNAVLTVTGGAVDEPFHGQRRSVAGHDERRVLFLVDANVVAYVRLFHDVPRPGVQQYGVLVEFGQVGRSDAHQRHAEPGRRKGKAVN